MKSILIAVLAVAILPSMAFAGGNGGGTKSTGTIKVINEGDTTLLVILKPSTTLKTQVQNGDAAALSTFNKEGGKRIAPGHSFTFRNVRSGTLEIGTLFLDADGNPGTFGLENVTVNNRQNVVLHVSGDETASPVIDQD